MTCSGLPVKRLRSTGSCVATPTGQVLRWHLRIMMQPAAISGAVAMPNSSAPSRAPMTTARPVRTPPSTCTALRPRSPLATRVRWVAAGPVRQGAPACCGQRRGARRADRVGPEQGADAGVAAGADAAVDLYGDAAAQPVGDQRRVGLGEADLPGRAGVLQRGQRRGAGAALVAGDGDVVGAGLGN